MKIRKLKLTTFIIVIIAVSLACGSESSIEVNPSSVEEPEAVIDEPTATSAVGTVRSNPAPIGSEIVTEDMAFVVLGSIRPANDIILGANMFNTEPEANQEYVMVQVQISCRKSVDDRCDLYSSNLSALGSTGILRDPDIFVAGVDGLLDFNTDFYGGATVTGYIPFIVEIGESDLLLVYEPFLGDSFYLAFQ